MTEYELDKLCEQQQDCSCNYIKCELFARYINSNNN